MISSHILIWIIFILQIVINSYSGHYVDIAVILLIIFILENKTSFNFIIYYALFADCISKWYLGSHLFVIVVINMIASCLIKFYDISDFLGKIILIYLLYVISNILLTAIYDVSHMTSTIFIVDHIYELLLVPVIYTFNVIVQDINKS
jgi:hypothetical protein